jgi:FAD/FMN-containing dehydrogenase
MSELRKDNSGFDLRDLFIGAEGTLGIITGAVLKLVPKPRAYATAMVALADLPDALALLHRLQETTGGAVEAFEYMPKSYMERHLARIEGARPAFDELHEVNIMFEIGATAPRDAAVAEDGSVAIVATVEDMLAEMIESGQVLDAVVARTEAQRREMWKRREDAAEVTAFEGPIIIADMAVPLDRMAEFLTRTEAAAKALDPAAQQFVVAHMGDGNVHLSVWASDAAPAHTEAILEAIEDVVEEMGGSFSAEHGIGLSKRGSMRRRKDKVALDVMARIKAALDPGGIMNPGKVLP